MNFKTVDVPKGRPGQEASKKVALSGGLKHHMTEVWEWAETANKDKPLPDWTPPWAFWSSGPLAQEWVPTSALQESKFNSRIESKLDHDHIERLKDSYPWPGSPVVVRKGTFEILDGNHRWHACWEGIRNEILPVVEVDVDDTEALLIAIAGNSRHGRVLTQTERCHWARELLAITPQFSDNLIANITGATGRYVREHRSKLRQAEIRKAERENRPPAAEPETRIGLDGRETKARGRNGSYLSGSPESGGTLTRSRDPQAGPDYDEPSRDIDEEIEQGVERPGNAVSPAAGGAPPVEDSGGPTAEGEGGLGHSPPSPDLRRDADPSAETEGSGAHSGGDPVIGSDEWERFRKAPGLPTNAYRWLPGLSDAARLYLTALQTAAATADDTLAEVHASPEARKDADWNRSIIAEQGKVPA